MFSLDEVEKALPTQLKGKMSAEIVNNLNLVITDAGFAEQVRNNLISYTNVLSEGKYKLESYMDAVIYVSFKMMGYTDKECYMRTFPTRYADLVAKGTSTKDIAAYVAAYNRGQLVNKIFEQTLIPTWVLNQDVVQKAINVQADLMMNGKSETVRMKAADSILNHLKKPDAAKLNINLGVQESDEVKDLKAMMATMVQGQQKLIAQGHTTKAVAHADIIDVSPN